MKKYFVTSLFILISLRIIGQENYLTPCVDFGSTICEITFYQEGFNKAINRSFNEDYMLRFIAQPSFTPEYAVQVRKINDKYYEIETQIFRENFWEFNNRDSVQVDFFYKALDQEVALHLDSLFNKATAEVHSRDASVSGLDGEQYFFFRQSAGEVRCGSTWSPNIFSPLGRLIIICNDLIQYSLGNTIDLIIMKEEIVKLCDEIE